MNWYYAENHERRGPIEDAAFHALVAAGTIRPDTLVWRDGLAEWVPYSQVAGSIPPPPVARPADSSARACSQCGRLFPADELIVLSGRAICATCKPLVVQQMIEGTAGASASSGVTPIDPEQFLADLRARGGYEIAIGSVLSRTWATIRANFWPCVGVTLLVYFAMLASQQIPCIGVIASFALTGPFFGGLYVFFLKQLRGQPAALGDAFSGFNKPHVFQLALASSVVTLLSVMAMLVLVVPGVVLNWSALTSDSSTPPIGFILWCCVAIVPFMYLTVAWMFSYALVIDRGLEFWPAMELSRKVVNMNLWGWFLFMLVLTLLSIAGVLALCVGFLVVLPVFFCSLMVVYEDIFAPRPGPTA